MIDVAFLGSATGQLVLSALCAGFIGFEREIRGHPAGLRTHILVSVGATLITLGSIHIAIGRPDTDSSRIAAQIVSGIGFLGAGTIIQQGSAVRGLTTAASLWATAGVGIAIGVGRQMLIVALIATLLMYVTLAVVRSAEHIVDTRRSDCILRVSAIDPRGALKDIMLALSDAGADFLSVNLTESVGGEAPAVLIRI
ncbi:MAG: MgtC/SapB family protein, partial [Armatimonadetes bacterium]|nr:MgtC/SapB family protein [Armatimonadota bacterium]